MLKSRYRDKAAELGEVSLHRGRGMSIRQTYVLFHVLLSCIHGSLAKLKAYLRRGVVHEASECRVHVVASTLLGHTSTLLSVSISALRL